MAHRSIDYGNRLALPSIRSQNALFIGLSRQRDQRVVTRHIAQSTRIRPAGVMIHAKFAIVQMMAVASSYQLASRRRPFNPRAQGFVELPLPESS